MPLRRDVSLTEAVFYGVGTIVGAGIYALIGVAAGITGASLWLAFVLAGIIAGLTAFSYSKLSSRYPKEAAESVYVLKAFGNKRLSFFVGYVSLITVILSIATVAWGFATYFKLFVEINPLLVVVSAIILFSIINFIGIDKSVKITGILTLFSVLGLVLIIIFGLPFLGSVDLLRGFSGETGFALMPGTFAAAALIFFAFLGFESLANISEEIESPKKNAPKAIIIALCITTLVYVLVSIVSVSVVSPEQLVMAVDPQVSLSQGPLALVADSAITQGAGFWMSILALFATSSTILALLVVASRILYGLSKAELLPSWLSKTHSVTGTPYNAIIVASVIAIAFSLIGNIEVLGNLTTVGTFLLFFMVNASLIVVIIKENSIKSFSSSNRIDLKGVPIFAVLGASFCLWMFLTQYWSPLMIDGQPLMIGEVSVPLIAFCCLIFATSYPLYSYFNKKKRLSIAPQIIAERKFAKKK